MAKQTEITHTMLYLNRPNTHYAHYSSISPHRSMWSLKAPDARIRNLERVFHLLSTVGLVTFPFISQGNNLKSLVQEQHSERCGLSHSPRAPSLHTDDLLGIYSKPELTQTITGPSLCQSKAKITQDHSNSSGFTNTRDNPMRCSPNPPSIPPSSARASAFQQQGRVKASSAAKLMQCHWNQPTLTGAPIQSHSLISKESWTNILCKGLRFLISRAVNLTGNAESTGTGQRKLSLTGLHLSTLGISGQARSQQLSTSPGHSGWNQGSLSTNMLKQDYEWPLDVTIHLATRISPGFTFCPLFMQLFAGQTCSWVSLPWFKVMDRSTNKQTNPPPNQKNSPQTKTRDLNL